MEHILSLSYGKDSCAAIGAIKQLGWPLDRIVTADVWATDTIPADLPEMVRWKAEADRLIKERWGIPVEHVRSKNTYQDCFYSIVGEQGRPAKSRRAGQIYGWPYNRGPWCNSRLKLDALSKLGRGNVYYLGIAADEPDRIADHEGKPNVRLPLVEAGWTEADCRRWCEDNGLLSPIYTTETRGGCWFCHNQGPDELRRLRKHHPDLWAMMLKWDADSPGTFQSRGRTLMDYEQRFLMEDAGLIYPYDKVFRWAMLDDETLNYRWF